MQSPNTVLARPLCREVTPTISMYKHLFIAVGHSKAAVPDSARTGLDPNVGFNASDPVTGPTAVHPKPALVGPPSPIATADSKLSSEH